MSENPSSRVHGPAAYLLGVCAVLLVLLIATYVATATVLASIAPRLTGNASFDQKLLFIKNQNYGRAPLGLVVGSSMALNDLDADALQRSEGMRYLNVGAWSMSIAQSGAFAAQLEHRFNVKELILVVQVYELTDGLPVPPLIGDGDLDRYLSDNLVMKLSRLGDLANAVTTRMDWGKDYGNVHSYDYLGFTSSGSVPLQLGENDIDQRRWTGNVPASVPCRNCMTAFHEMCAATRRRNIPFFVAMPPLSLFYVNARPNVRRFYEDRRKRLEAAAQACGAQLFEAGWYADFDRRCFADPAHLNSGGDEAMTRLFIAWKHGSLRRPQSPVRETCSSAHS